MTDVDNATASLRTESKIPAKKAHFHLSFICLLAAFEMMAKSTETDPSVLECEDVGKVRLSGTAMVFD